MKPKLSLILLVMLVTMPTTISAISDPFTRIRTLVFGEFNRVLLSLILALFCPDLGLFLFDVGSDIYNGVNFIDEGNPIWGWTVIGLIFLPMTVHNMHFVKYDDAVSFYDAVSDTIRRRGGNRGIFTEEGVDTVAYFGGNHGSRV